MERTHRNHFRKELQAEQHHHLIEIREHLHLSFWFQRVASIRLDELHAIGDPITVEEENTCWDILTLSLNYERRCDAEYCAAAGLECDYALAE